MCADLPQILNPVNALPGVPRENVFQVLDDTGMKLGSASVVEYINDTLLPERPLNYYVSINAREDRAFDMLLGAVLARSLDLHRRQRRMPARIYVPCRPSDTELLRNLQSFGFQNDDAEIRMRRILHLSDQIPQPPVGCTIAPVVLEDEVDANGLLERVNRYSLTTRSRDWLMRLQQEQLFTVLGVWQDSRLLGELILTAYGTEGTIEFVYTRPEFRKRGVATSLIAYAGNMLLQNAIRSLNAQVWRRNQRAMTLFQAMQFDSVSPIILYPGIDLS